MDSRLEDLYQSLNGIQFSDRTVPVFPSQNHFSTLGLQDSSLSPTMAITDSTLVVPLNNNLMKPSPSESSVPDHHDDYDFSDVVLKYINQLLMEEDAEERPNHAPSALEATEKSLYEVIGEEYPPSHSLELPRSQGSKCDVHEDYGHVGCPTFSSSSNPRAEFLETGSYGYVSEYNPRKPMGLPASSGSSSQKSNSPPSVVVVADVQPLISHSSTSSSGSGCSGVGEPAGSPASALTTAEFSDSDSILQFNKGITETTRYLPAGLLPLGLENTGTFSQMSRLMARGKSFGWGASNENGNPVEGSRGRKHHHAEDSEVNERIGSKQPATSDESILRSEMFDMVLLCSQGKNDAALRKSLRDGLNKDLQNDQHKALTTGKGRGRRRGGRKDVVDLRTLLTLCAQSVASNDQRNASELLRQIRLHSSEKGDGIQRVAHYLANGLEARLAGVGNPIYTFIIAGPTSAADILRAYHLFLATCPFKKLTNFFSNRTIMAAAEKAKKVHIIDFGILYGFQWPCLIQRLSSRPGGPPNLRITGIDLPQPGFRPAKRVEETGRRLRDYADSFNVPFDFNPIAKKWESVTIEDLKIEKDEVVIVNSIYRLKYLPDETVMVESPRNIVLNLIKKVNPHVFIQGIVNGAYSAPFFTTRFREALFHFSTIFDMLETNVPREVEERILIEREIFGRQAMNVIACEGTERVERPETYKQWQLRNERSGFRHIPLNCEIVDMAKDRVRSVYHSDFVIDEDGPWLLQGWKGRILYAISCWKPSHY